MGRADRRHHCNQCEFTTHDYWGLQDHLEEHKRDDNDREKESKGIHRTV